MNSRTEREVALVMSDFNVNMMNENTGFRASNGCNGVGTMNKNGQHLADSCANKLVIGETLFPH